MESWVVRSSGAPRRMVHLTDITCILRKQTTVEEINGLFKSKAEGELKGILEYTEDPIIVD